MTFTEFQKSRTVRNGEFWYAGDRLCILMRDGAFTAFGQYGPVTNCSLDHVEMDLWKRVDGEAEKLEAEGDEHWHDGRVTEAKAAWQEAAHLTRDREVTARCVAKFEAATR